MKLAFSVRSIAAVTVAAVLLEYPVLAGASQTDVAQAPLGTAPTVTVLPNLMFILDDSGSMARDHMPDQVNDANTAKSCTSTSCNVVGTTNQAGFPPYYAAEFNTVYYNPQIRYKPGVDSTGASLGNANPNNALDDPYSGSPNSKDAVTTWTDIYWCTTSSPTTAQLSDPAVCQRNGVSPAVNPFDYATQGLPSTTFRNAVVRNGNPHYYTITPREFCSDETMVNCATTLSSSNPVPAPVRWCKSATFAADPAPVTGNSGATAKCQSKVDTTYKFPRLGNITRTDIVSTTPSYPRAATRSDCTGAVGAIGCSYAEEIQNFANWYSYYRSRMLMMKSSAGAVFSTLDDRYRVGFLTINASSSAKYLKIDKFEPTHKAAWFTKFYAQTPIGSTPLRQALSRVGRHYAGMIDGMNLFMPDEPIQYSCQQNFTLLTTDGYWNSSEGKRINGTTAVGNQDDVDSGFSTRAAGAYDGGLAGTASDSITGSSNTLADVAMYYYKTDLRPTGTVSKDNVPTSTKDTAAHQHMVTFTLGLGLDGLMTYRADYETAGSGDFFKIKSASTGCSWASGTCNWPQVRGDSPSALDDLWHAAVNGRGTYFSAKDPNTVQLSISNALSSIKITTGAAASSATSTPNITPTDNFIYSSTYRTVKWDGEVVAEKIDVTTGAIIPGIVWSAQALLDARVTATTDTRTLYTLDATDPTDRLKPFLYANLSAAERAFFDNKCITADLPQCGAMNATDLATANSGSNMVNYLRGQSQHETAPTLLYRDREHVLGDTVNAKPAFVGKPNLLYGDAVTPDYASFKAGPAGSRQPVLYIAANDGMLHAFNGDTGNELWAYVPRTVMPNLYKLAANNYDINHRFYVDGSASTMDVFIGGAWKTILVGGLNAGGRGYYALDVTDPVNPKGLWEFCSDATLCAVSDANLGLSYGQAVITKRPSDGKWVVIVTSGYNNVSPGDGNGYLYVLDAETGAVLSRVGTTVVGIPVGNITTPSGFAKIAGFATNFAVNNTTTIVYGADLLGNVWKYDMATVPPTVKRIAQLMDAAGKPQSVTTRPEVTRFDAGFNVVYVGTGRLLGSSDLQDPATLVPPENLAYQQTVYAFKDTDADLGDLRLPAAKLVQQTLSIIDSTSRTISNNPVDWSTQNGWFVDLNPANDSPGERVNIDMLLVRGVLLVATNEPNSEPCSSGGDSFFYQFDYQSGSYVASAPGQVVGVRSGSALMAGFVVYRLPSGQLKYTGIDVSGKKTTGGVNPGSGGAIGKRVSWRELIL